MPFDSLNDTSSQISNKFRTKYRQIFEIQCLTDIENDLTDSIEKLIHTPRCEKCGFPLKDSKKTKQLALKTGEALKQTSSTKIVECFICRRTRILNSILIGSYVISFLLFAAGIIGVIFDQLGLDIALMIGCLELILLLFFGRFLEDAVFFGLPKSEKALAALHRFAISGELQAYDIALKYLKRMNDEDYSNEFYKALIHVIILQSDSIPFRFFTEISKELEISSNVLIQKISTEISNLNPNYLTDLLTRAPPIGISTISTIAMQTSNSSALELLNDKLLSVLSSEKVDEKWKQDFYINEEFYARFFDQLHEQENKETISTILEDYKAPNVPSIDVVESSRKILNHPLVRYITRIFIYILLAILLSWLYRLLD